MALGILAEGIFAEGILAERNFHRTEFSPNGNFAERNFRRHNFRGTEFLPKNSPKLSLYVRCEVDDNQEGVDIELVRNTNIFLIKSA